MLEKIRNAIRKIARSPEFLAFRKKRAAMVGLVIVSAYIIVAIFAGLIAPYNPTTESNIRYQGPSLKHLFGTDSRGRDIFSRVIYGSRPALETGFLVVIVWSAIGIPLGVIAGYWRKADFVVSRAIDVAMAFPILALAIVFVGMNGSLIAIFGLTGWVGFAKLTRDRIVQVREAPRKRTAKEKGSIKTSRRVLRVSIALVLLGLPVAILLASVMSFLGLGVRPPTPDWGYDLNSYRIYMADPLPARLMIIFPGMALTILIMGFYLMSDWLREIFDQEETFYLPGTDAQ
jgi:peptide/nickel transport system permease protein